MTQLELVENDINPCFSGLARIITVIAVSSSYSALVDYCKETCNIEVCKDNELGGDKTVNGKFYTIENSKIAIVPSKF